MEASHKKHATPTLTLAPTLTPTLTLTLTPTLTLILTPTLTLTLTRQPHHVMVADEGRLLFVDLRAPDHLPSLSRAPPPPAPYSDT